MNEGRRKSRCRSGGENVKGLLRRTTTRCRLAVLGAKSKDWEGAGCTTGREVCVCTRCLFGTATRRPEICCFTSVRNEKVYQRITFPHARPINLAVASPSNKQYCTEVSIAVISLQLNRSSSFPDSMSTASSMDHGASETIGHTCVSFRMLTVSELPTSFPRSIIVKHGLMVAKTGARPLALLSNHRPLEAKAKLFLTPHTSRGRIPASIFLIHKNTM